MAKEIGWVGEDGKVDHAKLGAWLYNKYHISDISWLTAKKASDAIEGLKAMIGRKQAV
jgi:hypothetical protein